MNQASFLGPSWVTTRKGRQQLHAVNTMGGLAIDTTQVTLFLLQFLSLCLPIPSLFPWNYS